MSSNGLPRFNMWGASHGQPGGPVEEADGEWVKWEDIAVVSASLRTLADSMEKNGTAICGACGAYSMYTMAGEYLPILKDAVDARILSRRSMSEWELRVEYIWQTNEYI